jgi:hypothetical protein
MKHIALAALTLLLPATAHPSDLDVLVAKVVDAYGGSAAWAKVTSIDARGRVVPAMRKGDGAMTRVWRGNDNLRVEIVYPDKTETRILENGKGTNNGRESNAMELDAMRLQALRMALPRLLTDKRATLRQAAPNTIEIAIDGLAVVAEVDPATGRIVRSTGRSGEMAFATNYSDFRTVNGILIPFHEENSAMGMKTADIFLDKVEVK